MQPASRCASLAVLLEYTEAAQISKANDAGLPIPSGGSTGEECSITPGLPALPGAGANSDGETAENWKLIPVNGEKPLSEDFSVPELTKLKKGQSINSGTYPHPENDGRNPGGGVQAPDLLPLPQLGQAG